MASSQEKREFDKYLKFLTFKVAQVIVQSRQGTRLRSRSTAQGNDWFNLSIPDDKQVMGEMKRSLEGRLPKPDHPVCIEIQMETPEGDTLVLEVWSVSMETSKRDIGVSVTHVLYNRLSLMLKSLIVLSRTTPAYLLSRRQEDLNFTFRVYLGPPEIQGHPQEFHRVNFAEASSPHGTIGLSVLYRTSITLPTRSLGANLPERMPGGYSQSTGRSDSLTPGSLLQFPFAPPTAHRRVRHSSPQAPFGAILPAAENVDKEDSPDGGEGTLPMKDESQVDIQPDAVAHEQDSYIMVDLTDIKPAFACRSHKDELSEFLQQCREVPTLDMFSGDNSMDVTAALKLIDKEVQECDQPTQSSVTVT